MLGIQKHATYLHHFLVDIFFISKFWLQFSQNICKAMDFYNILQFPQLEIARPALNKDIITYCIWRSNSPLEKFQSSSTSIKITEGIFKQKR